MISPQILRVPNYIRLDIIDQCGSSVTSSSQLDKVQRGEQPDHFKPMGSIGKGVEEIRMADHSGAYRVIYCARRAEAVYALHAFQKKTQTTSRRDIEITRRRFGQISRGGR
jgi:phage-related protein